MTKQVLKWGVVANDPRGQRGERDAHQSANGDCRTNVKIVETYGRVWSR
jgi:hypothetical protein